MRALRDQPKRNRANISGNADRLVLGSRSLRIYDCHQVGESTRRVIHFE